jgi:hypothetical protein
VWNIKLWTFDFRAAATELICLLCLKHKDYFNHPIELCCSFTEVLSTLSINFDISPSNQLWIPKGIIFRKQLFFAMVSLKRCIWHNYTSTLHNEDSFLSTSSIIYKWLGILQANIEAVIHLILSNPKLLSSEKERKRNKWSLNNT